MKGGLNEMELEKIMEKDNTKLQNIVQETYDKSFRHILYRLDECYLEDSNIDKIESIYTTTRIKAQTNEDVKKVVIELLGGREFPAVEKIYSTLQNKPTFNREDADGIYNTVFNRFLTRFSPNEFSRDYNKTIGSWGDDKVGYKSGTSSIKLALFYRCFEEPLRIQFEDNDGLKEWGKQVSKLIKYRNSCRPGGFFDEETREYDRRHDAARTLFHSMDDVISRKAYIKSKELAKKDFSELQKYIGHEPSKDKIQQYFKEQSLRGNAEAIPAAEEILGIRSIEDIVDTPVS